MARGAKDISLGGFLMIILAIGAVIRLIQENQTILPFIILGPVALLIICYAFILIRKKTRKRKITEAFHEDYKNLLLKIDPHLNVLSRKRSFLITIDDYGYKDYSRWISEKNTFVNKFNYQSITTNLYGGLSKDNILEYIDDIINNYQQKNQAKISYSNELSPFEYEQYCAYVLNQHGWAARTTRGSGDQGVDVIAKLEYFNVAIQCKKYSSPVGNSAVQEVTSGMHYWGANIAVVVTNTSYTKSARELAKSVGVLLLHHEDLPNLKNILDRRN